MTPLALAMAAVFGAFFEVHTIPLDRQPQDNKPARARTFFASADNDTTADLFIVQGNTITAFSSGAGVRETVLPQGVTAFDVADVDADGQYEIVAIQGRSVFRFTLALQGDMPEPVKLFDADSLYARGLPVPTPVVLVVPLESAEHVGIALPTTAGLELHALDGALVSTQAYATSEDRVYGSAWMSDGAENTLTVSILANSVFAAEPSRTPSDTYAVDEVGDIAKSRWAGSALSLRNAIGEEPVNWPWFTVRREQAKATRAYCAVEESLNTLIRACDVPVDADGSPAGIAVPGPERRYPGAMIPIGDSAPDFNGDGYADILLWNAPRPGISVDALLRAVVGRNWPIALTAHLYSPDKGRFEPMAATELTYRIPVTWFLTGLVPLRHDVLADFNGDGKTDLGMCTEENEYSVWLYSDGFATTPDEKHTFTENITGIELTDDVAGNGKTSIVLRSDHYVYALYAK